MKICRKCHVEKPFSEFWAQSRNKTDGRQAYCKECRRAYMRTPEKKSAVAAYSRQYRKDNPERVRGYVQTYLNRTGRRFKKEWRDRLRRETLMAYGGLVCTCCGETEILFLALDHINGGGTKHRTDLGMGRNKKASHTLYRALRDAGYPSGYQVLCHNCNWGKHINGVCPHKSSSLL